MSNRVAAANRLRHSAERQLFRAQVEHAHAQQVLARAKALASQLRQVQAGMEQRYIDAEVATTQRWINQLTEPYDQLRYPDLKVLDPYFLAGTDLPDLLNALLDTALEHTAADMGNIQFFIPGNGLHIAAHRGFKRPFLDFFTCVGQKDDDSACAVAANQARSVMVADVTRSAIFTDTTQEVLVDARVRAVQSFPLLGPGRYLFGVFSVHYHKPGQQSAADLYLLSALTRAAVRALTLPLPDHGALLQHL